MTCTAESHAELRKDAHLFLERTVFLGRAEGLTYGNCHCGSTLCLTLCKYCGVPCPTVDELPVGDEFAHMRCYVERKLRKRLLTFSPWRFVGTSAQFLKEVRT